MPARRQLDRLLVVTCGLVLAGGLVTACRPAPPRPAEAPPAPSAEAPGDFSAERAWRHVEALAAIGPREPGSEGAARARAYLRDELRLLGLEVTEQRSAGRPREGAAAAETVNLVAVIPGTSSDRIALIAPYDNEPGAPQHGASAEASGAALVLELGRALEARGSHYALWLAFVEGDALLRAAERRPPRRPPIGTELLVAALREGEGARSLRLAAYFHRVAAPELRVARDLLSNRAWREEFFAAGRRLGHAEAFPADAAFESVEEGHRAFLDAGMRQAVAITASDLPASGEQAPEGPQAAPGESQRSARESLAIVGRVSLEAIESIARRLEKIDRFVASPIDSQQPATPSAGSSATSAPAGGRGGTPSTDAAGSP